MRGDLRQSSLAELMRHLYAERRNGILRLALGDVERRIYFKKGVPIFADAPDGQIPSQDRALSLLYSLFGWTAGTFTFEEVEPEIDDACAFGMSPSVLILEGSRSVRDTQILEHLTGGRESVFACAQTSELPLFTMRLSSTESAILKFARERQRFVAGDLPFASEDVIVVNALNALLSVGLLEMVDEAASPAPNSVVTAPVPVPETAPLPAVPTQVREAGDRSEVESLLDTFESRRTGAPISSPSMPTVPPSPPVTEAAEVIPEPTPLELPPSNVPVSESVAEPPAPADRMPLPDLVSRWIPKTERTRRIALAVVAFVALAGIGLSWLSSPEEPSRPNEEEVAGSTPEEVRTGASAIPSELPETESEPRPESEPERSEAELFYSASLAFENGEYERSRADLTTLLDRQPDFQAARELLNRVEREIEPATPTPAPRPEPSPTSGRDVQKPRAPEPKPEAMPEPEPEPVQPAKPDPATLLEEARRAFASGELGSTGAKLNELKALDADYPGAETLREQLVTRLWERNLPIVLTVRHDHALGGCEGVLTLTKTGYGYRSNEHEWIWGFGEVAETVRRDSNRLRLETRAGAGYNFDLRDELSDDDWARHQALADR